MTSFFDFRVTGIQGEPDLLGPLRGQVVLAVNVASRCGYTPQYTGLERLHGEIKRRIRAVGSFPDRASALRLIISVALRVTSIWTDRRYLDMSVFEKQEAKAA